MDKDRRTIWVSSEMHKEMKLLAVNNERSLEEEADEAFRNHVKQNKIKISA